MCYVLRAGECGWGCGEFGGFGMVGQSRLGHVDMKARCGVAWRGVAGMSIQSDTKETKRRQT